MLTCSGTLTLPERTLTFLTGLLQTHREQRRTGHTLPARDQTLLVLAHLPRRRHRPVADRRLRHRRATAHRYLREAVDLLADLARTLTAALGRWPGSPRNNVAILDETIEGYSELHRQDR